MENTPPPSAYRVKVADFFDWSIKSIRLYPGKFLVAEVKDEYSCFHDWEEQVFLLNEDNDYLPSHWLNNLSLRFLVSWCSCGRFSKLTFVFLPQTLQVPTFLFTFVVTFFKSLVSVFFLQLKQQINILEWNVFYESKLSIIWCRMIPGNSAFNLSSIFK